MLRILNFRLKKPLLSNFAFAFQAVLLEGRDADSCKDKPRGTYTMYTENEHCQLMRPLESAVSL